MIKKLIFIYCLFLTAPLFAANIFVDTSETDCADYAPDNAVTERCGAGAYTMYDTIAEAIDNAVAGDVVYFRGDSTYTISEAINDKYTGNDGTAENPITYRPYGDESVTITATCSPAMWPEHDYHQWQGIDYVGPGTIFRVGEDTDIIGFKVSDFEFTMTKGGDNTGLVYSNSDTNTIVTHGVLTGPCIDGDCTFYTGTAESGTTLTLTDTDASWDVNSLADFELALTGGTGSGQHQEIASNTGTEITVVAEFSPAPDETTTYAVYVHGGTAGVIAFNASGIQYTNLEISNFQMGIYYKHGQALTTDTNINISKNYIYNCETYSMELNCHYADVENNIIGPGCGYLRINEANGGAGGDNNLINHNTVFSGGIYLSTDLDGADNNTITNNIISSYTNCCDGNTWDYNMYVSGSAIGAHELANTSPTYVGGANPSTISGYALDSGSNGEGAGSDGKDTGADVSLVGNTINSPSQMGITETGISHQ